jgi:ATP-binding cassette subfamily C protein
MVIDDLQSGAASLGRIVGVIEEGEATDAGRLVVGDPPAGTELVADSVSFGYSADHSALQDVSITIAEGEQVALVGASGAGKSTLASLLAGIHPVDSGDVRFGGVDVRELAGSGRAGRIALLSQDVHIFAGPLSADLRMVAPDAEDSHLRSALEAVDAWVWVSVLDDGIDTVVGAGGHQLTPVQVQQVALARLLLLDPDVVILDEATADAGSFGAETLERAAQAAIADRSALVIAHRLSQAATADRVVLMDSGRIVEVGTHDDLVAAGGRYARLWAAWSLDRPV